MTMTPRPPPRPAAAPQYSLATAPEPLPDPDRLLIYGARGVGKSSLAASFPKPLLLPIEMVGKMVMEQVRAGGGRILPRPGTWQDLLGWAAAMEQPSDYETLILDGIDVAEALCWVDVVANAAPGKKGKPRSIEDVGDGYGKGYVQAVERFRILAATLERALAAKPGRRLVMVTGAPIKPEQVTNPLGPDYSRWAPAMQRTLAGFICAWASDVFFLQWEGYASGDTDDRGVDHGKLVVTGARVIRTQENGPWVAKNRSRMPPMLNLPDDPAAGWGVLKPYLEGEKP